MRLRDAEAAVNLVGILQESGAQAWFSDAIQHLGAQTAAKAVKEAGSRAFSCRCRPSAHPAGSSLYARTKAFGEAAVRQILPGAIIMRPSVVFGPEDQFFNRFAAMARFMPALPLDRRRRNQASTGLRRGCRDGVIALAVEGKATPGTIYELGGPEVATLRRINEFVLKVTGRRRPLIPISFGRARSLAFVTEIIHKLSLGLFPAILTITSDQVKLLRCDNIVSPQALAEGRLSVALASRPNHSRPSCRPISTVTAKPGNSRVPAHSERSTIPAPDRGRSA